MTLYAPSRCNRLRLFAGLCAWSLLFPAVSWAIDPVDQLKQALALPVGDSVELQVKRKKMIEGALQEFQTMSHLRRAYFLSEWGQVDLEKDRVLQTSRKEIGDKITRSIRASALEPDLDQQLAAAMWIAEIGEADQSSEAREKFARGMTGIVLGLVKEKQASVRQAAFHALGRVTPSPAEAFPVILNALQKDELGPRRLAAYALTDLVKNIKLHERNEQMDIMDQVVSTAAVGLKDSDESIRGYSLQAIHEAAKAFHTQVSGPGEEPTVDVKGKVVLKGDLQKILRTMQVTNPQLLQALYDPKINIRLTSLQTLDQINNARWKIIQKLQDLAPEKNELPSQTLKAYDAPDPLGNIVEKDWTYIARLLKEDEVKLRRSALEFLELLGEQAEPAMAEITLALRDPDHLVRWSAVRTIRNIAPKKVSSDAVRALAQLLMDPDPDIGKAAASTLEALGPVAQEAVDALAFVIGNGDSENRSWDAEIRIAALKALVSIGPDRTPSAIPKIVCAVADPDVRLRRAATETLGRYGAAAKDYLQALRQALRDDDSEVRLNASEAILSITRPAPKKGL